MKFKSALIILICFIAVALSLPTLSDLYLPSWLMQYKVKLGLDLRGGSSILLEVDTDSALNSKLVVIKSDIQKDLKNKYDSIDIENNQIIVHLKQKLDNNVHYDQFITKTHDKVLYLIPEPSLIYQIQELAVNQSLHITRNRIDETGINDLSIQRYGRNRILIQIPGIKDPKNIKGLLGKTAKLDFRPVHTKTGSNNVPLGFIKLPLLNSSDNYIVSKYPAISGSNLVDAQVIYDNGKPVVSIRFDNIGSNKFAWLTKEYMNKQLAIVLDNEIVSAPVINNVITNGSAIISGSFTIESANNLAILLRSGSLPAPIHILEERIIGPSLGNDSIQSGKLASVIAFSMIMIFMIVFYKWMGLCANIALIINVFLVIAILVLIKSTLTLPGIAGILLTIDMAVDANVLIFERIKEEYRKNKNNLLTNIHNGYQLASSSIIDSHITTFVVSCILFFLGSGPIKGFAVTLGLGVFTSIFISKYLTKMLVLNWYYFTKMKEL